MLRVLRKYNTNNYIYHVKLSLRCNIMFINLSTINLYTHIAQYISSVT